MAIVMSPNMQLPIPSVGTTAGPDYAISIDACLSAIDQHDHSTGRGVQITPAGMNINSTLTFGNNPATNVSYLNMQALGSATTVLQSLSVAPGTETPAIQDLWYTDSNGTAVQLTAGGFVNATLASIPGQSYAAGTFYWKQGTGSTTPANFDIGSITIRPNSASTSNGVTIAPPSAIASQYTVTLPLLPAAPAYTKMDTSGNITPVPLDGVTISDTTGSIAVLNGEREHAWELNGQFTDLGGTSLVNIDSFFYAPYNLTITQIWISIDSCTSGAVTYTLNYADYTNSTGGTISSTGKFTSPLPAPVSFIYTDAGSIIPAQTNVVKPDIAVSAVNAGTRILFNLAWTSGSVASGARIRIFYKQR